MAANILSRFLNDISVEPIGFLHSTSIYLSRMASIIFTLDAVCLQRFGDNATVDCNNLSANGEVQDAVQSEAIQWMTWTFLGVVMTAIISALILGTIL